MADAEEKKSPEAEKKLNGKQEIVMYLHDMVYMISVLLVVFLVVFRVIVVSGSSMYDTLIDGDYLLLLSNVFYREPEAGDIIVVAKESFDNGNPIIKRVIATEGQTVDIDFVSGVVYVDGKALHEPYTHTPTNVDEGMKFPLTVDKNCVFAMGDNRNGSLDSRSPQIGQVDHREILGKALFLFLPGVDKGHSGPEYDRIGAIK